MAGVAGLFDLHIGSDIPDEIVHAKIYHLLTTASIDVYRSLFACCFRYLSLKETLLIFTIFCVWNCMRTICSARQVTLLSICLNLIF